MRLHSPGGSEVVSSVVARQIGKKFRAFFQKDLYFDGLVPPVGGSGGVLRKLQLTQLSSDQGWVLLGYQLRDTADRVAAH